MEIAYALALDEHAVAGVVVANGEPLLPHLRAEQTELVRYAGELLAHVRDNGHPIRHPGSVDVQTRRLLSAFATAKAP